MANDNDKNKEKDWDYPLKGHINRFGDQKKQSNLSVILSALAFIALVILMIFL
ncbi:MAG: hypothetical protein MJY72_01250 [Bacteroidales bacterium]|nr:hypothetical protein [Bacteroidales bacterium]